MAAPDEAFESIPVRGHARCAIAGEERPGEEREGVGQLRRASVAARRSRQGLARGPLECPSIDPARALVQGDRLVANDDGLVRSEQLPRAMDGHLERVLRRVALGFGPKRP
jgi:hypothetical protein